MSDQDHENGAELFFQDGLTRKVESDLDKTGEALARGSTEVAGTHLKKGLEALRLLADNLTSPHLNDGENKEWKLLRDKEHGSLSDYDVERLNFLNLKAQGLFVGTRDTGLSENIKLKMDPDLTKK